MSKSDAIKMMLDGKYVVTTRNSNIVYSYCGETGVFFRQREGLKLLLEINDIDNTLDYAACSRLEDALKYDKSMEDMGYKITIADLDYNIGNYIIHYTQEDLKEIQQISLNPKNNMPLTRIMDIIADNEDLTSIEEIIDFIKERI